MSYKSKNIYVRFCDRILLPMSDILLGTRISNDLRWYESLQYKSYSFLRQLQTDRLVRLLRHTYLNIPFYRDIFKHTCISIDDINKDPLFVLQELPLLDKKVLKNNSIDRFVFSDTKHLHREMSSGSTGEQGVIYMDNNAFSSTLAAQTLLWKWAGYNFGKSIFQMGITPNRGVIKKMKDILFRTYYAQAYNLSESQLEIYTRQIKRKKVSHILGYASSLYVLAKWLKENASCNIEIESVISYGDKMFLHYRKLIEKQFNTKVFDTYGSTEGFVIAGQCEKGLYHILTPHVFLEVLDKDGNQCKPGVLGEVVATRLDSYAMPLIRYRLKDLAIIEDPLARCDCGRGFPLLKQIIGRNTDIVKTRDGNQLVVHFFTGIFEHYPSIQQFQIYQNSLDKIIIRFIPGQEFEQSDLKEIYKKILDLSKSSILVEFQKVDAIKPSFSGKPQIVISDIVK